MAEARITPEVERPGRVRQVAVSPSARALSTLSHIDYEDTFLVDVGPPRELTAEQWSRAVLEDAPIGVRCTLQSGWAAIGLKLGSEPSERFVLGWAIRRSTREFVLLGADSRIGMAAELLFKRQRSALLCATFVQKDNHIAQAVWAGVEPVHVPAVRYVLAQASRRCRPI
ncbi:MAG: hypothetical protein M3071_08615 [Actinomycetota bacterium]|nr:hypothetical protein [Actinomycetota bacterium]